MLTISQSTTTDPTKPVSSGSPTLGGPGASSTTVAPYHGAAAVAAPKGLIEVVMVAIGAAVFLA